MLLHPDGNFCFYSLNTSARLFSADAFHNGHGPGGKAPMRMFISNSGRLSIFDGDDNEIWFVAPPSEGTNANKKEISDKKIAEEQFEIKMKNCIK